MNKNELNLFGKKLRAESRLIFIFIKFDFDDFLKHELSLHLIWVRF